MTAALAFRSATVARSCRALTTSVQSPGTLSGSASPFPMTVIARVSGMAAAAGKARTATSTRPSATSLSGTGLSLTSDTTPVKQLSPQHRTRLCRQQAEAA